jgi:gliding motility-associated-like protein
MKQVQKIIFLVTILFFYSDLFAQTFNDGPIQLQIKVRDVNVTFNQTDQGALGVGFVPDELRFKFWARDRADVDGTGWVGAGNCLSSDFTPPGLSTDFNTVFSVFNYTGAVVPQFFDVRMEAFEDDIPVDGLLGFCNSGPLCTYTGTATCCGVILFGTCIGLNERDDMPCFADPFRNSMNYRLGRPCEWYSHGYVTYAGSGCANDVYIPRIESYWRYTKGTACNDAIDLGEVVSGVQQTHYNSNICYSNNFPASPGNDVFYQFNITQAMGIRASLCGANGAQFDSYLYLLDAGCNVIASDDNGCGTQSIVSKNLCQPGTYYLVVDAIAAGEQGSFTLIVEEDPSFTFAASITKTDVTCTGANDGTAVVAVVGGLPPYTYLWSTGSALDNIASLAPGNYIVTVSDDDGCSITATTTIDEPLPLTVNITVTDVTCSGANDGSATANPSGGTLPFTYQWNTVPQQTSATAIFLSAGTFAVVVTDVNNCTVTGSATINTSSVITPAVDLVKNISCFGLDDGEIQITTSGGVTPYVFAWSHGPATEDVANLSPGNYTITVTDADNCSVTSTFDITEPPLLQAAIDNIYDARCAGYATGAATITVTGGTPNYTYLWSNGFISQDIINVVAGSYDVTVTDANSCTTTLNAIVSEPAPLDVTLTATAPTCFGISNGFVTSQTSGGTPPYSYIWSTGDVTPDINNIPAGNYSVLVTDVNNCFLLVTVSLNTGPELIVETTVTDVLCNGDATGAIALNVVSGAQPIIYNWSNGSSNQTLSNVIAGNYNYTVTDADGCMKISSETINEPPALTLNVLTMDILCSGNMDGMAFAVANGGTPLYNYTWGINPPPSDAVASGLPAGNYSVTVADANNCTVVENFSITEGTSLSAWVDSVWRPTCYGGADGGVILNASGGQPPYEFAVFTNIFQGNIFSNLPSGNFGALILDQNGCSDTVKFYVPEPVEFDVRLPYKATVVLGAKISLKPSFFGTDSVVSWSWSPAEWLSCTQCEQPEAQPINDIVYTVTAIDKDGCVDTANIIVIVKRDYEIFVPNIFSPNADGINDVFQPLDFGATKIFNMKIFNRWGELIYETSDIKQPWDGTYKNKLQDVGVYTYYITGEFLNADPFKKTGTITLTR